MLRYRKFWLTGGWLAVGLVCFLSLTPHPPEPLSFQHIDKVEHIFAYTSLSLWFCQLYEKSTQQIRLALGFIAMGIVIEILQGLSIYRYFEYADMLANSLGAILGLLLAQTPLKHLFLFIERQGSH